MNEAKVCSHCRRDFRVRVSDDIGFYGHWVGDYFLIDVVLVLLETSQRMAVYLLHREVFTLERAC